MNKEGRKVLLLGLVGIVKPELERVTCSRGLREELAYMVVRHFSQLQ